MQYSLSEHTGWNGTQQRRNVLVAIDLSDQSLKALQWSIAEFYRAGDCIHLIHVSRVLQPQTEIHHSYPGATYTIPNLDSLTEQDHAKNVKEVIKSRFIPKLDEKQIPHVLHLYLDTDNAPASAVVDIIFKVAAEVRPVLIVAAAHNKAYGLNELLLGSVADYLTQHSKYPLMIVRDFKPKMPPLVIPVASPHPSPHNTPKSLRSAASSFSGGEALGSPKTSLTPRVSNTGTQLVITARGRESRPSIEFAAGQ